MRGKMNLKTNEDLKTKQKKDHNGGQGFETQEDILFTFKHNVCFVALNHFIIKTLKTL